LFEGISLNHFSDTGRGAEERYRTLVNAITDYAIFMLDPAGTIISWNAGAEALKGYTEDEILGEHFSRFYTPEDKEKGLPALALKTAAEEGRFVKEGWRVRKDGSRFWASVVIDPIWDKAGSLTGFAKVTRDLSERKAAEERVRKAEQQFRLLVQGVTDYAIYLMDVDGQVSSWNAGAQAIKGYLPDEIIGSHYSRFFEDEDVASGKPQKALECAARDGRFESEGWRVRKDGTRFWANAVIDAIRDENGELIGFAKITRDITDKREAQRALELAREELFQAQKMEAIGQLTGGIAHDFNNLLMAIQGSLELLKKRIPHSPDSAALLDNAYQAVQRGASLTQRMLAFSRKQELRLEAADLLQLVHGMTDMLQRSIGPTIMVETQFPLSLPEVWTDPNQLANAILNLAINARDAMPEGGALSIGARVVANARSKHPDLPRGEFVCLYMQDTGQGMDQETLAQAITPFFTTKGVGKGTGLGLPMVQGLMAQSHGKLALTSELGKGTTAELWLPVATTEQEPEIRDHVGAAPAVTKPMTVLAVDDDPLVLMNTVMMLEDMGHTVVEANSATQALTILDQRNVDMVITDQAMPRMTGIQLAANIEERWRDVAIIIATGYAELPKDANMLHLVRLTKPFTECQLAAAVGDAVQRQSAKR
jgi:PAS domain S-box-containing protein